MRKSTLVSIALSFLIASAAIFWVCYLSFKGSVMSFEQTNAPAGLKPQSAPTPFRMPPPAAAPAQDPNLNPAMIPTMAPAVTPRNSQGGPKGPPPPDA